MSIYLGQILNRSFTLLPELFFCMRKLFYISEETLKYRCKRTVKIIHTLNNFDEKTQISAAATESKYQLQEYYSKQRKLIHTESKR